MIQHRNIRNVVALPESPVAYTCTLDLLFDESEGWQECEYCARPGRGALCDAIITAIEAGQYEGEITPWQPGG